MWDYEPGTFAEWIDEETSLLLPSQTIINLHFLKAKEELTDLSVALGFDAANFPAACSHPSLAS